MAKKRGIKTGGRDWVPGQSGNPNGQPKVPLKLREFQSMAKKEIVEEFQYLWSMTESDLLEIIRIKPGNYEDQPGGAKPDLEKNIEIENGVPAVRKFIARAIMKAVRTGDMTHIDQILNRVIGKVKEEIDLNSNMSFHRRLMKAMNELDEGDKKDESDNEDL